MKGYLMKNNKEISTDKTISNILTVIISGFGTNLIRKYIDETTDTDVHIMFKAIILIIAFIVIYNIVRFIISLAKKCMSTEPTNEVDKTDKTSFGEGSRPPFHRCIF